MKMRYWLVTLLAGAVFSLSGCATMIVGIDNRDKMLNDTTLQLSPVYTRSHIDLWLIYFPVWAFTGNYNQKGDSAYAKTAAVLFGPFTIAFGTADLPISLVVDTVTLPWDLKDRKKTRIRDKVISPGQKDPD